MRLKLVHFLLPNCLLPNCLLPSRLLPSRLLPSRRLALLASLLVPLLVQGPANAQNSETAARQTVRDSWRAVRNRSASRLNTAVADSAQLIQSVDQLLAADSPDWFGVQEVELRLAETDSGDQSQLELFRYHWNRWLQTLPMPTLSDLASAAREASSRESSQVRQDFESQRRRLASDLEQFAQRLGNRTNAQAWSGYLKLPDLRKAVRDRATLQENWEAMEALPARWRVAALLLSVEGTPDVAESFERFVRLARVNTDPDFVGQRKVRLEQLADLLDEIYAAPDQPAWTAVGSICYWLKQRGTDRNLVAGVERYCLFPNLVLHVPESALRQHLNQNLQESFPVNEVIAGTRVRGSGQLTGQLVARFLPRFGKGALELSLRGQTVARTSGVNQGATVRSTGVTRLVGTKQVVIYPGQARVQPAAVTADTEISFDQISTGRRRFDNEARSRVYARKATAERESAANVSRYARTQLSQRVDSLVSQMNREMESRVILPMASRQIWPEVHSMSSDSSGLRLAMLERVPGALGALSAPPDTPLSGHVYLQVDGSFFEQLATRRLSGKTRSGETLFQSWQKADGSGPVVSPQDEWSVSFSEHDLIDVLFEEDQVLILFRLSGFRADGRDFAAMQISARYDLNLRGNRLLLERQGDLQIAPVGFVSGRDRLSGPQLITRKVLSQRLTGHVPTEIDLGDYFSGSGDEKRWQPISFFVEQGWLNIELVSTGR